MTRSEAIKAYQAAKSRGDTRAMHRAENTARKSLHDILSNPPAPTRMQWLWSILIGGGK